MNPVLLAALINNFALPELTRWLASRHGAPLTDADIITKLGVDAAEGIRIGETWLASHPDPTRTPAV